MGGLFIGFLVEKYIACQSGKSDFGWHRFRFSHYLMRKRVEKSEAILALHQIIKNPYFTLSILLSFSIKKRRYHILTYNCLEMLLLMNVSIL